MNAWIANMISCSVLWVAQQPTLSSTLLLLLQVGLLIALARFLVAMACRNNPAAMHRVWFLTAAITLVLLPIHALRFGWQLQVPQSQIAADNSLDTSSESGMLLEIEVIIGNPLAEFDPPTLPASPKRTDEPENAYTLPSMADKLAPPYPESISPSKRIERQSQFLTVVVCPYLLGMALLTMRAIHGTFVLRRIARRATDLSTSLAELLTRTSKRLCLPQPPRLKSSESVSMPFLIGLQSHMVLVPAGFEVWTRAEQEAVLLHELMHIKRNDCLGELIVRAMQIVYFFHPACWFLARKIRESRELATDRGVVEHGTDARQYANSLLSIIARRSSVSDSKMIAGGLAIPMSAMGKIEDRLNNILCSSIPRRKGLVRSLILMIVLAAIATTLRLESLSAQTDPVPSFDALRTQSAEPPQQPLSRPPQVARVAAEQPPAPTTFSAN